MSDFPPLTLFEAGELGYAIFRIPGIVRTSGGVLLAYCEARRSWSDWADIDVWMRRSPDGGETWEEPFQVSARHPEIASNPVAPRPAGAGQTCGSPVAIAGDGVVHLVYCVENYRCFYTRSLDGGLAWTAPREITSAFEEVRPRYDWRVFATGPGHGLQLSSGRLLVTAWLSTGTGAGAHRPSAVTTLYSDDGGDTWHTGEIVVDDSPNTVNPSEAAAVEFLPGRGSDQAYVFVAIRTETPANRRLVTTSLDGISGWSAPYYDPALFEPVCFAGMASLGDLVLFSNPDSSGGPNPGGVFWPRRNLRLRLSRDRGRTWPQSIVIDPGGAGYSDLAVSPEGDIYVLYEQGSLEGSDFAPQRIVLARRSLSDFNEAVSKGF